MNEDGMTATPRRSIAVRSLFACTALAIAVSTAQSQTPAVTLPDSRPGHLVAEWLRLCDSPNADQMTKWLAANLSAEAVQRVPAEPRARDQFALCTATGGLRVVHITSSDSNSIQLELVGIKSGWWFKMTLAANAAGKLDRTGVAPSAPAESAMPADLSDAAIASDVRHTVAKLTDAGLFSGVVTVARGTQTIVTVSGGYGNRTTHSAMTGSTQFTLGSMGKMFTAASIGQLVDQKKMSFGDTVGKFFPGYPNKTVRDKVTVGMLLSHTAGLDDFLGRRTPEMMKNGVKRAAEFMPLYDTDEPLFPPGTSWSYSNAGLALAGAIVEKVSGEDYPDYLRKHIFSVAGMANSDPNNIPHATAQSVTPYTKFTPTGPSVDWVEAEHDIGSPAGGAISTADDLVRFADALRSGKLVSKATLDEMTKSRATVPFGDKYGYAMEIHDTYGRTVVGHGGGFSGVSTHLYLVLGSPYTVVVLANQDPPADMYAGATVLALVAEKAKRGQ
jgi:CubicO group peptidase (beta-lactamase class C family)